MSFESVKAFLAQRAPEVPVTEISESTATVEEAARAYGVRPGQIAKTLSFRIDGGKPILIVARGDTRIDNRKIKNTFGGKAKMLSADEVVAYTGHPIGGVCPFDLPQSLPVYCDVSLKSFEVVMPAAGSTHSAVEISPEHLMTLVNGEWVDVCKLPETSV